jgi:outer membrane immunogenic protein
MKTRLVLVLAAVASAATMGVASAADMPVKAVSVPMAVPISSWDGVYIGGHVGGAWSRDSYNFDNGAGTNENFSFNPSSFVGGAQVGIQSQSGHRVIGLEGTWSATSLNQTQSSVILANINGPAQRSLKIDQIATVTGKLGYAWSDMLLYGKIGYAGARMKTSSDNLIGITSNASGWGNGATVGVGIDYKLYNNIILGAELDYYYVNFKNIGAGTNPPGFNVSYNNGQASIFAAMARVSYLFNWGR